MEMMSSELLTLGRNSRQEQEFTAKEKHTREQIGEHENSSVGMSSMNQLRHENQLLHCMHEDVKALKDDVRYIKSFLAHSKADAKLELISNDGPRVNLDTNKSEITTPSSSSDTKMDSCVLPGPTERRSHKKGGKKKSKKNRGTKAAKIANWDFGARVGICLEKIKAGASMVKLVIGTVLFVSMVLGQGVFDGRTRLLRGPRFGAEEVKVDEALTRDVSPPIKNWVEGDMPMLVQPPTPEQITRQTTQEQVEKYKEIARNAEIPLMIDEVYFHESYNEDEPKTRNLQRDSLLYYYTDSSNDQCGIDPPELYDHDGYENATQCCEENAADKNLCKSRSPSKCEYLKDKCLTGTENNSTDFCMDAVLRCCLTKPEDPNCMCLHLMTTCDRAENGTHCEHAEEACFPTCKCERLKNKCGKSLESNRTDFCNEAAEECCLGNNDPTCSCQTFDDICFEASSQNACEFAASRSCCAEEEDGDNCRCNYFSSLPGVPDGGSCGKARELKSICSPVIERKSLEVIFNDAGGDMWVNRTGWLNDTIDQCQWYGITCNNDGFVTEVDLQENNLTGNFPMLDKTLGLSKLKTLNLAKNSLTGNLTHMYHLESLMYIDVSGNLLSGHADLTFGPNVVSAILSNNLFATASFKRFNAAFDTLRVVDLSNNAINQTASAMFANIPPNLNEFVLTSNTIKGGLPDPFPSLTGLRRLKMGNNAMSGTLPNFPRYLPQLRELDLSNQRRSIGESSESVRMLNTYSVAKGLIGKLAIKLVDLVFLEALDLSNNSFTGTIPTEYGSFPALKTLNVKDNEFTGKIPFELGRLSGALKVMVDGNNQLDAVAPVSMCMEESFDLHNNPEFCPPERNILKEIYLHARGEEWTSRNGWGKEVGKGMGEEEYKGHCKWSNVECDKDTNKFVTQLRLQSNRLAGTLSSNIGQLTRLEVLDLSDNNLQGTIPTEIQQLTNLKSLSLRYNSFKGTVPSLVDLTNLEFIHLHGNGLSGEINSTGSKDSWHKDNGEFSFIADCGSPSDFKKTLKCDSCSMCCNNEEGCYEAKESWAQKVFTSSKNRLQSNAYVNLAGVLWACLLFAAVLIVTMVSRILKASEQRTYLMFFAPDDDDRRLEKARHKAARAIGEDSVYQYFLEGILTPAGWPSPGWIFGTLTVFAQLLLIFVFIQAADIDLTNGTGRDLVYYFKCPRHLDTCKDTSDLTKYGWVAYAFLMIVYLLKDFVNGIRLIMLAATTKTDELVRGKNTVEADDIAPGEDTPSATSNVQAGNAAPDSAQNDYEDDNSSAEEEFATEVAAVKAKDAAKKLWFFKARCFFAGMVLTSITFFTVYASTVYNLAIATSNTEIIINSVIIIFITDVDELLFGIWDEAPGWWRTLVGLKREKDDELELKETLKRMSSLNHVIRVIRILAEDAKLSDKQKDLLKTHLLMPADDERLTLEERRSTEVSQHVPV